MRSLRTSFRDAVGRADTALRREWDRLVNLLVDEVRFVFESGSTDDDAGESFLVFEIPMDALFD